MSDSEGRESEILNPENDDALIEAQVEAEDAADEEKEEQPKLTLMVNISEHGACERHVTVTVARADIDRYFDREFSQLMDTAKVPGFRPGHAPRKLVENKFRKEISGQVKASLLMDAIAQINEEHDLSAISEPDLNPDAVVIPSAGPMTFEFDIEVRPEFDLPKWDGLAIERPVRDFSAADVDQALRNLLARRGRLTPSGEPAVLGDYITANLTFLYNNQVVSRASEEVIRIRPVLSFRDGKLPDFDKLVTGVKAGETREGQAVLSQDAPNAALRGQTVSVVFEVLDVKKLDLPEITPEFLAALGDFVSEAELRDVIKDSLERRLEYRQHQRAREQIAAALTATANWDLPTDMLRRQSHRELQRAVLDLERSGFSASEIRAHENELRQNSQATTAQALKEHFIFERIAEEEGIEPEQADYDAEIELIALQTEQSARRVRARLEKQGMMDVLRNQIVERKVVDLIVSKAEIKEVPYLFDGGESESEAINQSAGGGDEEEKSDIPEAKPETDHAQHHEKPADAGPAAAASEDAEPSA